MIFNLDGLRFLGGLQWLRSLIGKCGRLWCVFRFDLFLLAKVFVYATHCRALDEQDSCMWMVYKPCETNKPFPQGPNAFSRGSRGSVGFSWDLWDSSLFVLDISQFSSNWLKEVLVVSNGVQSFSVVFPLQGVIRSLNGFYRGFNSIHGEEAGRANNIWGFSGENFKSGFSVFWGAGILGSFLFLLLLRRSWA